MIPEMQNIEAGFDLVRQRAKQELTVLVDEICSFDAPQKKPKSGFFGFLKRQSKASRYIDKTAGTDGFGSIAAARAS